MFIVSLYTYDHVCRKKYSRCALHIFLFTLQCGMDNLFILFILYIRQYERVFIFN
jgi:hypothetical protein